MAHLYAVTGSLTHSNKTPKGVHDIVDAQFFFSNIDSNLSKEITPQCGSICDTLLCTNCNSIFLSETNVIKFQKIVKSLRGRHPLIVMI